jgi:GTPase SAR1 family protein
MARANNSHEYGVGEFSPSGYHGPNMLHTPPTSPPTGTRRSFFQADGEEAELLDQLDKLQALNLPNYYPLPQIIVCGAQSSGKSSVLEAIARVPFQRKTGVCTRYKTKVTLKRTTGEEHVSLSIDPAQDRRLDEKDRLIAFQYTHQTLKIPIAIWAERGADFMLEANKAILSGSKNERDWAKDVLSITIAGPGYRSLQLVDLPGIIGYDPQNAGNVELVKAMVEQEMEKPYSFILAVVKATDDLHNHTILNTCRKFDPSGRRTLGVITRPDDGRENAPAYIKIINKQDEEVSFHHDWHVLLNRNGVDLDRGTSAEERDIKEATFFRRNPWNALQEENRGIESLCERLSDKLFKLAKDELPNLETTLWSERDLCQKKYDELGGDNPPEKLAEIYRKVIKRLKKAAWQHAEANYKSDIMDADPRGAIHLRSRVIDLNGVFYTHMMQYGQPWQLEGLDDPNTSNDFKFFHEEPSRREKPEIRSRDDAIRVVADRMKEMKRMHVQGYEDPKQVNQEIWKLSADWKIFGAAHIDRVFQCCDRYLKEVAPRVFEKTDEDMPGFSNHEKVAARFHRKHLADRLRERKKLAQRELARLEADRLDDCQNFDLKAWKEEMEEREDREYCRLMKAITEGRIDLDDSRGLDPDKISRARGGHSQEDQLNKNAEEMLMSALKYVEVSDLIDFGKTTELIGYRLSVLTLFEMFVFL